MSYAAAIREATGLEVQTEAGTRRGQFEVFVNDSLAIKRRGGLLKKLLGKPFEAPDQAIEAVRAAVAK